MTSTFPSPGAAPAAPGRRERKKLATREALHAAALDLVEERGLAAVTIEAITDRVDVAARTFFNYFPSKEEAVLGRHPADTDEVAAALRDALDAGLEPLDALEQALTGEVTSGAVSYEQLQRRMRVIRREPTVLAASVAHWEHMNTVLTEVVAAAVPGCDIYPALVVNVAVAAVRSALLRWSEAPDAPLAPAIADAFAIVRAGLHAPAPLSSPRSPR